MIPLPSKLLLMMEEMVGAEGASSYHLRLLEQSFRKKLKADEDEKKEVGRR